jgi:hypothetical protein
MGIYTKYWAQKKKLEQQIGLDTYAADLKALSNSLAEGGSAFGSAEGFAGAKQKAESLLGRTKALQEYVKLYGGDSTGLAETSDWLTGQKSYFDGFADFADYQGQKAEYERLSQNYDFGATEKRLAELREREAALPSRAKAFWQDFVAEASGESYVSANDERKALQAEIAALEKELGTARVYAAEGVENLLRFHVDSLPKSTNKNGLNYKLDEGAEGYDDVDWRHEYINGFYTGKTLKYDEDSRGLNNEVLVANLSYMTDAERKRYNYFYNTQGRAAAEQYLNGISDTLYARQMGAVSDFGAKHPVLGTLGALGGGTLSAIEEIGKLITGDTDQYNMAAEGGAAFQSGVAQNIKTDVCAFLYNTGVSALQSAATGILFGKAGGVVLGLSAMASTRNDLLRRGADPDTALKAGLAAGVFEGLFETLSLGQLTALKEVPVNGFKDLVLNIAKSMGVNASEEAATEVANILYDTFANGDFSEAQRMLNEGMSKGDIAKKYWAQIGEAAASGAVMGFGFGALGSGVSGATNAVNASRIGKAVKGGETTFGSVSGLTELGEKYGIKQTAKVKAKGTKASNRAVGDLYRRVSAAVALENKETTTKAIEKRLTDLGTNSEKAGKLADVVLKKYLGKELSFKESVSLDNSKVARQALSEMLENGNSKWVNDLRATLMGEESRDISTISDEHVAAAAEQAAEIARSEGAEVQAAASGESLGTLPKIAAVGANGMTLAAPTGEVALDETAMPEDKALLYTLAGLLPSAEIANDFVQAWDGATDPDAYFRAYQMIYTYGRNHTGYSDEQITEAGKKSGLGEAQIAAAFKSGVKSLAEERRIERERLDGIIQKFRESCADRPEGKWDAKGLRGVDLKKVAKENAGLQDVEQFVAFLRMTTKAFGWNVRVIADNSDERSNGGYDPATNTLTFNIYAGTKVGTEIVRTAMPNTISHETVHWMKRNAPEQYQALEDMVLAALKNANDYDFSAAVKKEYGKYKEKHGQDIDDATAREDIVARACEDLFGRSEAIQQFLADFAEKNKEAATGFTAAVKKVLAKIKAFFENLMFGHSSRTLEAGIVRKCGVDVVDGLMAQYEKTFFAALEGNAARNALGEFEQGGVRFALSSNHQQNESKSKEDSLNAEHNEANVSDARKAVEGKLLYQEELRKNGVTTEYDKMQEQIKSKNFAASTDNYGRKFFIQKKSDGMFVAIVEGEGSGGFVRNELNKECDTFDEAYTSIWEYLYQQNSNLYSDEIAENIKGYDAAYGNTQAGTQDNMRYSDPEDDTHVPAFSKGAILTALWDAMDHADQHHDNLIRVSKMPRYVTEKFGIQGDLYIRRNHTYENMMSEAQAIEEGRPTMRGGEKIHFHELGVDDMAEAMLSMEHPLMTIQVPSKDGNPSVVMMLNKLGANRMPLYAVLSFYSENPINGRRDKKPHVVATISPRELTEQGNAQDRNGKGRQGWIEFINKAIQDKRVLDYDKKRGNVPPVIAQHARLGNITEASLKDSIARFRKEINDFKQKNKIFYSDPEDDVKSDREILAGALMSVAQNEIERNALKVYQGYAKKLDEMNARLREVNAEIRTMMFQRGARDEAYTKRLDELKAEKDKLEKSIARWDSKLFALEVTKSLQDLLDREKQRTAKLWIDAGRKAMNNYREKQLCRVYTQKIEEKAKNLRKMLLENSEKYHIPDAFKKPVAAFLSLLDFSSERALQGGELTKKDMELQAAFEEVVTLLESLTDENSSEYLNGLDLPPDAVEEFVSLSKEVAQMAIDGREGDTMVLRRMSSEQLKTLNTTLYAMTRAVRQANDLFANERFRHVSEIALDFIGNSEQYAAREKRSKISDFLSWENMVPYYAFRRLGAAGEALFKGFMQGQDKFAFLVKEIIDFTDKLYTKDEVKEWSRQVHTFDGTNGKVYITTAQIMSLYELWKDKDARQHILGGGGRIQDLDFGIKKKYTNDPNGTALGELVVDAMFAKLTPRQKAVADSLQRFMAEECAKWGNEVSYKRWGIRIFGLDYYFPIESDKNTVAADVEQRAKESGLFSLLHKSFTKKRVFNANNRIMIRSVFDVFASHTTDMAKYHAFALPLLDMQKFINFKEIVRPEEEGEVTTELPAEGEQKDTSFTTKEVRASMEKAFGTAAYKYIEQFLIDLNGNIGGRSAAESILQKGITGHKIAAVGANLRVALLQPTAYMRLLNVMEPKYFFGGLKAGGHLKACIEKMQKYSGIALWKSLGYRDTNIAAPIQTKIKHDETWRDKVTEKSMILAELGDKVTWGAIWYACELEARDKHASLKVGSEEYYRAVAERFTEIIYATQVVDSTFTKSQLMRKKDFFSTLFTSFMSEPTLSYNLLASNALSLMDTKRRGEKITKAAAKPLVRAIGTFAIGALLQAAVESMIDAARGGADNDEPYGERYWEEFLANTVQEIVPLNLIPVVKDVWSIALAAIKGDYMQSSRIDMEVYNRIARAVKAVSKMFEEGEASYSAIYKILTALSSLTGLPISNLVRDVQAIWNTVVGDMAGGPKWKSK